MSRIWGGTQASRSQAPDHEASPQQRAWQSPDGITLCAGMYVPGAAERTVTTFTWIHQVRAFWV